MFSDNEIARRALMVAEEMKAKRRATRRTINTVTVMAVSIFIITGSFLFFHTPLDGDTPSDSAFIFREPVPLAELPEDNGPEDCHICEEDPLHCEEHE